jgi:hypothetical protein
MREKAEARTPPSGYDGAIANSPCTSGSRDSHLTRPEPYTPSAPSNRHAQVRSGDVCLRSPEADTAASIIAPHWVRFGGCTLSGNNGAPGTATHQPARTGLRTIQRP